MRTITLTVLLLLFYQFVCSQVLLQEDQDHTENFQDFRGTGIVPNPTSGALDANAWSITPSSGLNYGFGEDHDDDFFRRGSSAGNVSSGGIYAFEVESGTYALGVQANNSQMTPGTINHKMINSGNTTIGAVLIAYEIWVYNNQNRSTEITFAYRSNRFTDVEIKQFRLRTPVVADANPEWVKYDFSKVLDDFYLAPGDTLYFTWETNDFEGGGSRDQFAINNLLVRPYFSIWEENFGERTAQGNASLQNHNDYQSDAQLFNGSAVISGIANSDDYLGASGGANLLMDNDGGVEKEVVIGPLDLSGFSDFSLNFGFRTSNAARLPEVSWSDDGVDYHPLNISFNVVAAQWRASGKSNLSIQPTSNFHLKFEKNQTATFRFDDFRLTAAPNQYDGPTFFHRPMPDTNATGTLGFWLRVFGENIQANQTRMYYRDKGDANYQFITANECINDSCFFELTSIAASQEIEYFFSAEDDNGKSLYPMTGTLDQNDEIEQNPVNPFGFYVFGTKKWSGNGQDQSWTNPANWSPEGVPQLQDSVVLDHSLVSGAYKVEMAEGRREAPMRFLAINAENQTITLQIPNENTARPAIDIQQESSSAVALLIGPKAILENKTGATAGMGIALNGRVVIRNGGRYKHANNRGLRTFIDKLQIHDSTRYGKVVLATPADFVNIPIAGVRYPTLVLAPTDPNSNRSYSNGLASSNLTIEGNLIIEDQANWNLNSNATVSLKDSLKIDGGLQLTAGSGQSTTLSFEGSRPQAWQSAQDIALGENVKLVLDNAEGLHIDANLKVKNLKLEDGQLQFGQELLFTQGFEAEGSEGGYVVLGENQSLKADLSANNNHFLPIGTENYYMPFQIEPADGAQLNAAIDANIFNGFTDLHQLKAAWALTFSDNVQNADFTFAWEEKAEDTDFERNSIDVFAKAGHEDWEAVNNSFGSATTSGNIFQKTATFATIAADTLYQFTVADQQTPLPVELIYFFAEEKEPGLLLKWATVTEIDNKGFEVYRSSGGEDSSFMTYQAGAGNSIHKQKYEWMDEQPLADAYYWLHQIDFDGSRSIYGPIHYRKQNTNHINLKIFPNPTQNFIQIQLSGLEEPEQLILQLQDMSGKVVLEKTHKFQSFEAFSWEFGKPLASGVYVLHLHSRTATLGHQKVIIK